MIDTRQRMFETMQEAAGLTGQDMRLGQARHGNQQSGGGKDGQSKAGEGTRHGGSPDWTGDVATGEFLPAMA
jgi:hypothetical protein